MGEFFDAASSNYLNALGPVRQGGCFGHEVRPLLEFG